MIRKTASHLAFLLLITCSISYAQIEVFDYGSSWTYSDHGPIYTNDWKGLSFDDSSWSTGDGELGYGEGDENTVVSYGPSGSQKYITTYFRKSVNLGSSGKLFFSLKVDDGCVVYLNGNEVFRYKMPSGIINGNTLSSGSSENTFVSFELPESQYSAGENVISCEVHQSSVGSSDVSFDLRLEREITYEVPTNGLIINEFMASNTNFELDGFSGHDDWIEVYNSNNFGVDISGFYITDDFSEPTKFRLPTAPNSVVINPNSFIIFIANEETHLGAQYLDFKLSSEGEEIGIYSSDGLTVMDTLSYGLQYANISSGRPNNIKEPIKYFKTASPDELNLVSNSASVKWEEPEFSLEGGFYDNPISLNLNSNQANTTIYYTLDGSDPDPSNILGKTYTYKKTYEGGFYTKSIFTNQYNSSLSLSDKTASANDISVIPTQYNKSSSPRGNLLKANVVKAIAIGVDGLNSDPVTNTYFIHGMPKHDLPVVSFSTSNDGLFDYYKGIYVPGEAAFPHEGEYRGGNYYNGWEKSGYFEYFDKGVRQISQDVTFKMQGGGSRDHPQKSMRFYSSSKFNYSIFENKADRHPTNLMLRNSGNDWGNTLYKDAVFHEIVDGMNIAKQEVTPSVLYLNGEYWGIMNLRDRTDEYFIEDIYGVDPDDIDLVEREYLSGDTPEPSEGDLVAYNQLMDFLENNNFQSQVNYDSLAKMVDIESLIDYFMAEVFIGNWDWPHNNVRMWRTRSVEASGETVNYSDGKWRWILYDTDNTHEHANNDLTILLNYGSAEYNYMSLPFRKAAENSEFKNRFILRFCDMLNTRFNTNYTLPLIANHKAKIQSEMARHIERWEFPNSLSEWNSFTTSLNSFYQGRPNSQFGHLQNVFSLGSLKNVTLAVSLGLGTIKINTIDIKPETQGVNEEPYPWVGKYFSTLPINLVAVPEKGSDFLYWEKNGQFFSNSVEITVTPTSSVEYKAFFEENLLSENPEPSSFDLSSCGYSFSEWSSAAPTGTYPDGMGFVYMANSDPLLSEEIEGLTTGEYNLDKRTRVTGLNENGVSFINTGSENPGYPGTKIGGVVMALNTLEYDSLKLSFRAFTVKEGSRKYALRLQYRIGDLIDFEDVLDQNSNPIIYYGDVNGDSELFENILLPSSLMDKEYIQLFWRYYYVEVGESGSRDEIGLDDIEISRTKNLQGLKVISEFHENYKNLNSSEILQPNLSTLYKAGSSVSLNPGFETKTPTNFIAEVSGCP